MTEKIDFYLLKKYYLTNYFPLQTVEVELLKPHTVVYNVVAGMHPMGVQ